MLPALRVRRLWLPSTLRVHSTLRQDSTLELRGVLQTRVKDAMRAKNISVSTTLRSILAEINAADKATNSIISSSSIITILRKASARRHDAAVQFKQANRPDLAERELAEASLLEEFLPPLLSNIEIDRNIQDILATLSLSPSNNSNSRKMLGRVLKEFYDRVDRSLVDTELVKARVNLALSCGI